ncbi:MAG: DUF4870 domain-containing protein [Ardenticatenales bacterium]|nr:DUF4870 domain-containing protein [Ardenticatenales bacterium]
MEHCLLHLQLAHAHCQICGRPLCGSCLVVEEVGGSRCATHGVEVGERERFLASAVHLCALLNFFLPLVGSTGAMVALWYLAGPSPFVSSHTREAMSFQLLYFALLLSLLWGLVGHLYCLPLIPLLILLGLGCSLVGARRAWEGERYSYPLTSWLVGI